MMKDDKRVEHLIEYLKALSQLKTTRINEQNRVIGAIEDELELIDK